MAFKSKHLILDSPNDSAKDFRIFCRALVKFTASDGSTKVVVIPSLGKVTLKRLYVPPYKLLEATIRSQF